MTCKHLFMCVVCDHPEVVITKDCEVYYPVCEYEEETEDKCPFYEEKK